MTEFLLIRHGANDYTRTHKLAGWLPNVHLNEHGRAQAAAVGERLSKTTIHALYASPLDRTMETAQAIAQHHPHLTVQPLETVGELRMGVWEGQELGKLAQRRLWQTVQFAPSRVRFPGGETFRAAQQRGVDALEALCEQHPRQTIVVVSHSDMLKLIVAHYLGLPLDLFQRLEISTASLTILTLDARRAVIKQMNETAYLPPEPRDHHTSDSQAVPEGTGTADNTQTVRQT
ncbi:MAG: histidine phosphatase family protein [Aggregatilineales bacterium]